MMTIAVCAFDWSGTISDDREPVYEANMRLLEFFKKPRITFDQWLPKTTITPYDFLVAMGVETDNDTASMLFRRYYNIALSQGKLPSMYEDVPMTLVGLEELMKTLVVISSHPSTALLQEARNYGIRDFFRFFYVGSSDKAEDLTSLCKRFDTRPERVAYIGDTVYDVRAAKKAGSLSVAVSSGYHTKERLQSENPDYLIDRLSGLLQIIS